MNDWIKIHDSEWTPERLSAELSRRADAREAESGPLEINVPAFGEQTGMPQPPRDRPYNANLYHHLKLINEMPPRDSDPILADSPATRTPWVGNLWQRFRGQLHELILFYVNRAMRQQVQMNSEVINTLNELTRTVEAQQEEIQRLKAELKAREEK
jgi:uncharacterized small protein (DUF1192 family)